MLADETSPRRVALYWDFDNVVLSRFDSVHGRNAWSNARYSRKERAADAKVRLAEAKVDLGVVMEYAATLGTVAINRAYADWSAWWMHLYRNDLLNYAVDLTQLFPLSGTKNGADIRLACDVIEDLNHHADITHVIVVAGDSDFVALAQRCRRNGRTFVGIGVDGHTSRHLINACDEFKFYQVLANDADTAPDDGTVSIDPADGQELLSKALEQLLSRESSGWVLDSRLEPMMQRLDPLFDRRMYGYDSFSDLVAACEPDMIEHRDTPDGHREYRFAEGGRGRSGAPSSAIRGAVETDGDQDTEDYAEAVRATNISFPTNPDALWSSLEHLPSLIGSEVFTNGRELQRRLAADLGPELAREVSMVATRVGGLFRRTDSGQRLRDDLSRPVIRRYVALGLADRIRKTHGHSLDEEKFTALVFGSTASDDDHRIVQKVLQTPTVSSYAPLVADVLRPPALIAVLESLAADSQTVLGTASEVRGHLADAAEQAGFTLSDQDRSRLWSLLLEAGILGEHDTGRVERLLTPRVDSLLDALLDALGRRVTAASLPFEADLLARSIDLELG